MPVSGATAQRHVLVVANETVAGTSADRRADRSGQARTARAGHRDLPGQPAARGLRRLRRHAPRRGAQAPRQDARRCCARPASRRTAFVVEADPVDARPRRVRPARAAADEIVVSTHPAGAVRLAAPQRGRPHPRASPATLPSSTSSSTSTPRAARRTCSWSRTRRCSATPLLDKIRERARRVAGELPDRLAAERLRRRRIPRRERRLRRALVGAAQRGHRRARPDRAPRSVHRRDAGRRATSASTRSSSRRSRGSRSGWLRRDLVERLRKDTKLPVEHVVVDVREPRRRPDGSAHADARTHHHGPPAANDSSRIDARVLGMFLFIGVGDHAVRRRSSRPTSSSGSSTAMPPWPPHGAVPPAGLRRGHEHARSC